MFLLSLLQRSTLAKASRPRRCRFSSTWTSLSPYHHRRHVIFGANTDVGKTIVAAGLVRASRQVIVESNLNETTVKYVKPMQCGGSDESFVRHVLGLDESSLSTPATTLHPYQLNTLFDWETPASPHTSSRLEGLPISDQEVLQALQKHIQDSMSSSTSTISWYETAGGVLSPGASSPDNDMPWHARQAKASRFSPSSWGWQPQADLYRSLFASLTAVLVGDARLGGISATLSALESLLWRGYHVPALVLINPNANNDNVDVHANAVALREYTQNGRYQDSDILVVDLPAIPPDPTIPLDDWYRSNVVSERFLQLNQHLADDWEQRRNNQQKDKEEASTPSATAPNNASFAFRLAQQYSQRGREGLKSKAAQEFLTQRVVDDSSWASHSRQWVSRTDEAIAESRVWGRQMALATYQKRMRVTPEQRDSMEWAICMQSVAETHCRGHEGVEDNGEATGEEFSWVSAENLVLEAPTISFADGTLRIRFPEGLEASEDTVTEFDSTEKALDVVARQISPKLYSQYKELIEMQWLVYEHTGITRKIGAILVEPVLSRNHVWVDPLWQRALVEIGEARNIPIIFDETGLDIEVKQESERLNVEPDIAIVGSRASASVAPIMTTLYTAEVNDVLTDSAEDDAESEVGSRADGIDCMAVEHKLHLQSLSKLSNGPVLVFPEDEVRNLSTLDHVTECFALGNVLSISTLNKDEADLTDLVDRIRAQLDTDVLTRVDNGRIVTIVDSFVGREDRRNVLDLYRKELQ